MLPSRKPTQSGPLRCSSRHAYWRRNVILMLLLLSIWAFAGLGCGIVFADRLNSFRLGGYPLGFWFAQQGSILVFVFITFVYCLLMNRLDARYAAPSREHD